MRWILPILLALPSLASAQPDLLPAEHAVYGFLRDARTAGALPEYRHEVLPLSRGEVLRMLDSLTARHDRLAAGSREWLTAYRRELEPPKEHIHSWVGDGEAASLDLNAERYLAYSESDDGVVRVAARAGLQVRQSDGPNPLGDPLSSAGGAALVPELTMSAHWRDWLGATSSTFNGLQITGDTRVLRADPEIASLYYVGIGEGPPAGSYDRSTAALRVAGGPFAAEIANARLRMGPSPAASLLLSDGADYFPYVRASFSKGPIRYQMLHGALSDRTTYVSEPENEGIRGPERYLALHRLEAFTSFASVGFSEMVVYGLRGPELAYLNPLYPIKPAEHALWDRDNSLFAVDAAIRPLRGLELAGTFLADDLNFERIGEREGNNNKWAVQASASLGLLPGITTYGEYTRIEPYVYTHRFQSEHSFYNSYTHNGLGLGHPLGPNADQWLAGARTWLPLGLRLEARARYVRRGENPVDPETGATIPVGGDVRDGTQADPLIKEFLGGDVYRGPGASLDLAWEPVNSVLTRLQVDWQRWDIGADRLFIRVDASVQL